jgi:hypothetical protein
VLFEKSNGLLIPPGANDYREAPADFVKSLQDTFGDNMHVEWNMMRKKWVIEQCSGQCYSTTRDGVRYHSHACNRIYVWLVEDEDKNYMPLGAHVLEKLRELDTSRKYGVGEAALRRFLLESKNIDEERDNKFRQHVRDEVRHARRENRVTFNKLKMLFDRHSMKPNR